MGAGAGGRGGAVRRPDVGAGWDVDSSGGMRCEIMRESCVWMRCPSRRSGASPPDERKAPGPSTCIG
jgi:hypothetical protein